MRKYSDWAEYYAAVFDRVREENRFDEFKEDLLRLARDVKESGIEPVDIYASALLVDHCKEGDELACLYIPILLERAARDLRRFGR